MSPENSSLKIYVTADALILLNFPSRSSQRTFEKKTTCSTEIGNLNFPRNFRRPYDLLSKRSPAPAGRPRRRPLLSSAVATRSPTPQSSTGPPSGAPAASWPSSSGSAHPPPSPPTSSPAPPSWIATSLPA